MESKIPFRQYAILRLFVYNIVPGFQEKMKTWAEQHNERIRHTAPYSDSGFDILVPNDITILSKSTSKIPFHICAEMKFIDGDHITPTAFYLYPRSSLSKTPLRLSNSVGIIDAGYRGEIMAAFDNWDMNAFTLKQHERYLQLCHHTLCPILVEIVPTIDELSTTARGDGGFGSTGK